MELFSDLNNKINYSMDIDNKIKKPNMYKVIMHNDHYTTMDFVVEVLIKIFHKSQAEANKIMLNIHNKGKDICGIFTFDIAITKIDQVHKSAKSKNYPLRCSYEKA